MKKGLIVGISFLFIIILFTSFISAGFFSNIWGKITGNPVEYPEEQDDDGDDWVDYTPPTTPTTPTTPDCVCPSSYECGTYSLTGCNSVSCGDCGLGGNCIYNNLCDCLETDVTSRYPYGLNYYLKGICPNPLNVDAILEDKCSSEELLTEWYFPGGSADSSKGVLYTSCYYTNCFNIYNCSSEGKICIDGACIAAEIVPNTCETCQAAGGKWCEEDYDLDTYCEDSCTDYWERVIDPCPGTTTSCTETDDGFKPYIYGTMGRYQDNCVVDSDSLLYETICDLSSVEGLGLTTGAYGEGYYVIFDCPNGCEDGECQTTTTTLPDTCEECTDEAYTWCQDTNLCVSGTGGCSEKINFARDCIPECISENYGWTKLGISDENIGRYLNMIQSKCSLTFKFGDVLDILPYGYNFSIPNKRVVKILNITSDSPEFGAVLNLTLDESKFKWPLENVTIYVEESPSDWTLIVNKEIFATSEEKVFNYVFETDHFSLFLITEPYYCNNGVFEPDYFEECDGSDNCTFQCVCDVGYDADESGFCLQDISGDTCSTEGEEDCRGYNLYECDSDLKWDKKGKVIGNCNVKCSPVGDTSCQGEYPLRCGTDYDWDSQTKVSGLCGYTSTTTLSYSGDSGDDSTSCGDGYCGYNEDESNCPQDCGEDTPPKKWMLPFIISAISLLILVIIIVLFKIYKKETKGPVPSPHRGVAPAHRPGPKRPPGRPQEVHHGQMGRPPARKVSPGGYAIRRYPPRS